MAQHEERVIAHVDEGRAWRKGGSLLNSTNVIINWPLVVLAAKVLDLT